MKNSYTLTKIKGKDIIFWFDVRHYGNGKFFSWANALREDGKKLKFLDPYPAAKWKKIELLKLLQTESNWEENNTLFEVNNLCEEFIVLKERVIEKTFKTNL